MDQISKSSSSIPAPSPSSILSGKQSLVTRVYGATALEIDPPEIRINFREMNKRPSLRQVHSAKTPKELQAAFDEFKKRFPTLFPFFLQNYLYYRIHNPNGFDLIPLIQITIRQPEFFSQKLFWVDAKTGCTAAFQLAGGYLESLEMLLDKAFKRFDYATFKSFIEHKTSENAGQIANFTILNYALEKEKRRISELIKRFINKNEERNPIKQPNSEEIEIEQTPSKKQKRRKKKKNQNQKQNDIDIKWLEAETKKLKLKLKQQNKKPQIIDLKKTLTSEIISIIEEKIMGEEMRSIFEGLYQQITNSLINNELNKLPEEERQAYQQFIKNNPEYISHLANPTIKKAAQEAQIKTCAEFQKIRKKLSQNTQADKSLPDGS